MLGSIHPVIMHREKMASRGVLLNCAQKCLNIQNHSSYTSAAKKEVLINEKFAGGFQEASWFRRNTVSKILRSADPEEQGGGSSQALPRDQRYSPGERALAASERTVGPVREKAKSSGDAGIRRPTRSTLSFLFMERWLSGLKQRPAKGAIRSKAVSEVRILPLSASVPRFADSALKNNDGLVLGDEKCLA